MGSHKTSFFVQDFVTIQRESFMTFLKTGIVNQIAKINPLFRVSSGVELLVYPNLYKLKKPEFSIKQALLQGKSYTCKLYLPIQIVDRKKKRIGFEWALFADLPIMTKRGHFIINGSPRVIVNQIVRSPGIYYRQRLTVKGQPTFYADIIPQRGTWLRLEYDWKYLFWARMKKAPKIALSLFLQVFGWDVNEISTSTIEHFFRETKPAFADDYPYPLTSVPPLPSSCNQLVTSLDRNDQVSFTPVNSVVDEDLSKNKEESVRQNGISFEPYKKQFPFKLKVFTNFEGLSYDRNKKPLEYSETNKKTVGIQSEVNTNTPIFLGPPTTLEKAFELFYKKTKQNIRQHPLTIAAEVSRIKEDETNKKKAGTTVPKFDSSFEKEITSESALGRIQLMQKFLNPKRYDLGQVGRLRLNTKFNLFDWKESQTSTVTSEITTNDKNYLQLTLTKQDILYATEWLIKTRKGEAELDDIDDLKNRRVKRCGDLLENQLAIGLMRLKRIINKKGSNLIRSARMNTLITSKPINGALREFFSSSPLSQYMDQTNPLAEITHKRRLSSLGPGGVNRDTAGMDVRGIHPTHYGRICPIETPEGKNAGLVSSITILAQVDINGFLQTPFYNVVCGQVQKKSRPVPFLANEEDAKHIAPGDLSLSHFGFLPQTLLPIKASKQFRRSSPQQIEYIGVSPLQMISVATSLIPFFEHNDANRALMGSNMQRQALPLLESERPIVATGLEARVASDSGHTVQSESSGLVSYICGDMIIVQSV